MASSITNHTCGYFCEGNSHAVEAIAKPEISAAAIREGYETYVRQYGWRVVAIRAAPEADPEVWKKLMGWHWDPRLGRPVPGGGLIPGDVVCWLVTIEKVTTPRPEGRSF